MQADIEKKSEEVDTRWGGLLFRLLTRSPFPQQVLDTRDGSPGGEFLVTVHLAAVNEMNLFPHDAFSPETAVSVDADIVDGDKFLASSWTGRPLVPDSEYPGLIFNGMYGRGKGAVTIRAARRDIETEPFYIKLSVNPQKSKFLNSVIVPLMIGPFFLREESLAPGLKDDLILQPFRLLFIDETRYVKIAESTSDLPGKIWDSAFFAVQAVFSHVESLLDQGRRSVRVLDLSTGNGAVGLYLYEAYYKILRNRHPESTIELIMTDIGDALPLIKDNTVLCCSKQNGYNDDITISELYWGDKVAAQEFGDLDLIIACDLIYETEYIDPLFATLDQVCQHETSIFIGYKHRGFTKQEHETTWGRFGEKFQLESLNVRELAITGKPNLLASDVGVQIWKLARR
ncbi:putative methyltransferase-domain-containing protein [Dipodascopsis uninucleata]